jgi:hypothetical protein
MRLEKMQLMKLTTAVVCVLMCATAFGADKVVKVTVRCDSEHGGYEAYKAMDGNPGTIWHTQFSGFAPPPPHELLIDLGSVYEISGFAYLPRKGGSNGTIGNYEFYVSATDKDKAKGKPVARGGFKKRDAENVITLKTPVKGRYVRLRALSEVKAQPYTSVAELRIISKGVKFQAKSAGGKRLKRAKASRAPQAVLTPADEMEFQYQTLANDIRKRRRFTQYAPQTFNASSLIIDSDRDPLDIILRRTTAVLADIGKLTGAPDLSADAAALKGFQASAAKLDPKESKARLDLFKKVCTLRRKISFSNPLLNFDKILFITRHRSRFNHMCDQYYGVNTLPGGSIHVLSNPFGDKDKQKVRDVLADSKVEIGRLKGTKLDGSFLSPDLSYDAKEIAFAYVECKGKTGHDRHTDPSRGHWDKQRCYHVFKVNVDGTALKQLTDGTWNDFDPCWMPNGRLAFITERRGGYLRCGRTCPTYTLYDMKDDGTEIQCLSYHETNEWHPSVTHDGMIIYTRWDYVDRHGCTAHLPWITTPDGRDSRAVHGNFAPRGKRPDMELDIRAIPGSHKYVATAAPHHGQAFGSLVMFDPRVPDDDAMAPVKRLTPDVAFPETQGGGQVYATAWPLSENYYLCVYDPSMKPGMGRQGRRATPGKYGIYLVDVFGNKELIYRDAAIACQSPMPLRPRKRPPIIPDNSTRVFAPAGGATLSKKPETATLALVNVYDSLKKWPEGTKVKALRIYQIIPMSVPSGGPPHEIGLRPPTTRDSVILARYVLGTVPVEKDGSAHFTVPAHRELFFQALDEKGLAIQSMRSSTYLQANERLTCQGCHEQKHNVPLAPGRLAIAHRRKPDKPKPDVDGSNPFSYPRLVQPVLEKNCVKCHEKNAKDPKVKVKPPDLSSKVIAKGRGKWYASYHSLAQKYGFWSYGDGWRTTPGKFGARASKLYPLLTTGSHKDRVKLSAEDLHRITLWLDSCSIFYGVYEKEGGEAQLRGEIVRPTLE